MNAPSPFQLFFEGDDYFSSLRRAILVAKSSIDIEIYYFASDEVGWGFAKLLETKAKEGIKVRMIYDDVGCQRTSLDLLRRLAEAGVELKVYHPVLTRIRKLMHRNHRKIVVIDGETVFLGGYNLASEYSFQYSGASAWRDTGVKIQDAGLANEALELFEHSLRGRRYAFQRLFKFKKKIRNLKTPRLVASHGFSFGSMIRHGYLLAIHNARSRVWITNAYFIPDRSILRALARAACAGLDVRVLTAGKTDVRVARWAGQATYAFLLKAGVRIYEYQPRMMHAKAAVIDDAWFTIGTANLDKLSFFRSLEVNLMAEDPVAAKALIAQFNKDILTAKEIKWSDWKKRSWILKVWSRFLYMVNLWL